MQATSLRRSRSLRTKRAAEPRSLPSLGSEPGLGHADRAVGTRCRRWRRNSQRCHVVAAGCYDHAETTGEGIPRTPSFAPGMAPAVSCGDPCLSFQRPCSWLRQGQARQLQSPFFLEEGRETNAPKPPLPHASFQPVSRLPRLPGGPHFPAAPCPHVRAEGGGKGRPRWIDSRRPRAEAGMREKRTDACGPNQEAIPAA
jgi:hypothetical protein